MQTERRKYPRKKPEHLIYIELGTNNGGMMRDLSEGGIGFRAVSPVRKGEKVHFAFAFDPARHMDGEGELVWTDNEGKAGGLRFAEVSGAFREGIRAWLGNKPEPAAPKIEIAPQAAAPFSTLEEIRQEIRRERASVISARAAAPKPLPVEEPLKASITEATVEAVIPPAPTIESMAIETQTIETKTIETKTSVSKVSESRPDEAKPSESEPHETSVRVSDEPLESLEKEKQRITWLEKLTLTWAVGTMLVLTVVVVSMVYHRALGESLIWLGEEIAGEPKPAQVIVPEKPVRVAVPELVSETVTKKAAEEGKDKSKASELGPAAENAPRAAIPARNAEPPKNAEPGQMEFLQALQILRGKNRGGELPEAVRLLWVAVEKGNSGAEVALADLYRRGEGIPQNCDQTRVLLTAAAKKGNAEAKNRLAQLEREGCP